MTTAELEASLAYWRREYSIARGLLAKARRDARAGGDGRTPGVVTASEARHIKKRAKRVDECLWYIERRKDQLASRSGLTVARAHGFYRTRGYGHMPSLTDVIVHHTAGPRPASMRETVALIRAYDAMHSRLYGGGIGYHELIDPQGRVYPTRAATAVGAHTARANTGRYGIAFLDNFDERKPTRAQLDTLHKRLRDRPPGGLPDLRGLPVSGHRDWAHLSPYNRTACPGAHLIPVVADY